MSELTQSPALKINGVSEILDLVSAKTHAALTSKRIASVLAPAQGILPATVAVYHSFCYKSNEPGDKEKAYQLLAESMNELQAKIGIVGHLVLPSEMSLYCTDLSFPKVVFCFPHILYENHKAYKAEFLNSKSFGATNEGEVGESVSKNDQGLAKSNDAAEFATETT